MVPQIKPLDPTSGTLHMSHCHECSPGGVVYTLNVLQRKRYSLAFDDYANAQFQHVRHCNRVAIVDLACPPIHIASDILIDLARLNTPVDCPFHWY